MRVNYFASYFCWLVGWLVGWCDEEDHDGLKHTRAHTNIRHDLNLAPSSEILDHHDCLMRVTSLAHFYASSRHACGQYNGQQENERETKSQMVAAFD